MKRKYIYVILFSVLILISLACKTPLEAANDAVEIQPTAGISPSAVPVPPTPISDDLEQTEEVIAAVESVDTLRGMLPADKCYINGNVPQSGMSVECPSINRKGIVYTQSLGEWEEEENAWYLHWVLDYWCFDHSSNFVYYGVKEERIKLLSVSDYGYEFDGDGYVGVNHAYEVYVECINSADSSYSYAIPVTVFTPTGITQGTAFADYFSFLVMDFETSGLPSEVPFPREVLP